MKSALGYSHIQRKLSAASRVLGLCALGFYLGLFHRDLIWAGERKKALDFEEQTVEGMNKRPLDSLNSLTDGLHTKDGKHLYTKKKKFRLETQQTLRDLETLSWKR